MKFQDIIFLIIFLIVALKKDPKISTLAGLACLFLAIPLFYFWIFFTAQHLVWYAAAFFLLSVIFLFKNE